MVVYSAPPNGGRCNPRATFCLKSCFVFVFEGAGVGTANCFRKKEGKKGGTNAKVEEIMCGRTYTYVYIYVYSCMGMCVYVSVCLYRLI